MLALCCVHYRLCGHHESVECISLLACLSVAQANLGAALQQLLAMHFLLLWAFKDYRHSHPSDTVIMHCLCHILMLCQHVNFTLGIKKRHVCYHCMKHPQPACRPVVTCANSTHVVLINPTRPTPLLQLHEAIGRLENGLSSLAQVINSPAWLAKAFGILLLLPAQKFTSGLSPCFASAAASAAV